MTCDTCTAPLAYRLGWRVRRRAAMSLGRLTAVALDRRSTHL
jgi:hypothetical protein